MTRRTTIPNDPIDAAARDELIADYTRRRLAYGVTLRDVARALNIIHSGPGHFESRRPSNPLISSLVRYGEVIELKPVLTLEGVDAPPSPTATALLACGYVGAAALATLIAARQHLGISQQEMSRRSGLTLKAVFLLERDDHEPHLATLQGYARGIGGRLDARWVAL